MVVTPAISHRCSLCQVLLLLSSKSFTYSFNPHNNLTAQADCPHCTDGGKKAQNAKKTWAQRWWSCISNSDHPTGRLCDLTHPRLVLVRLVSMQHHLPYSAKI